MLFEVWDPKILKELASFILVNNDKSALLLLYELIEVFSELVISSLFVTILIAPPTAPEPYNVAADPPLTTSILSMLSVGT